MNADPIVDRWQERERKNFLERLKTIAVSFFAVAFSAKHDGAHHIAARSLRDMEIIAPRICARLKQFQTRRPRPWRTWRGAQRTGRKAHQP